MAARFSLRAFLRCEQGATAIEYGIIVIMIFLAIVSAVSLVAGTAVTMFNHISSAMPAA
ncbi:MAG TPA: Flp family type IVb pilin [Caulobacteraceae bacterium]